MMQKLHKTVFINASREKVWDTMLNDATYRQWTEAFNPGSYYKGSWDKGSKILFVGPNPEGTGESGMVSRIKENKPHEFISIEHVGIVANGVEDTASEEARKWSPADENYTFVDKDGGTEVIVDIDVDEDYRDMFDGMWTKGLSNIKELAEK